MKKLLYVMVILVLSMNLRMIQPLADERPPILVTPVEVEADLNSYVMDLSVITPDTVALLAEILPKEIIAIVGTTAASTGFVVSTPVVVGVCILLGTLGIAITGYNFWKYYNKLAPVDNGDGTVTFHPTLENTPTGNLVKLGVIEMYQNFFWVDTLNVPVGDYICLGTFDQPSRFYGTARFKNFGVTTNKWYDYIPQQNDVDTHNVFISLDDSSLKDKGTVMSASAFSNLSRDSFNTYMSVWTPQVELFRTFQIKGRTDSISFPRRQYGIGVDHWSNYYNSLKGTYNVTYKDYDSRSDAKFSIWIKNISDEDNFRFIGGDIFHRYDNSPSSNSISSNDKIRDPEFIPDGMDYTVTIPEIDEDFINETEPFKKPELFTPTDPNPDFDPFKDPDFNTTPTPDPDPDPDPNPNPNPDPFPDINESELDTELDFSPLFMALEDKFPFCIPFDIMKQLNAFSGGITEPRFVIDMSAFGSHGAYARSPAVIDLDLREFHKLFMIVRYFILISFCIWLMVKTRDLIRG